MATGVAGQDLLVCVGMRLIYCSITRGAGHLGHSKVFPLNLWLGLAPFLGGGMASSGIFRSLRRSRQVPVTNENVVVQVL